LDEKGNVTGVLKDASDMIDTAAIKVMGDDSKPLHDKLLQPFPDYMLGPDGKGPPTLVLSMEDTLVHTTWDRRNGYRVAKRPGVDHFLQHVIPYYEIVLVSELPYAVGSEMMYNLDAGRSLHHHMLCREALCKVGRGKFVKDLSYLNRDLSQVIVIDSNPEALERNPSNLCQISKYDDPDTQQKDTELQDLESFLFTLATQRNPDFREVLKRYGNNNVGAQYKEKIEAHQKAQKERTRRFKK
jgi:import inner membrane translocase subunit TIM50